MNQQHLTSLHQIPWYIPSLYGDIRLTAQANQTEVEWENLSPSEKLAMTALAQKFRVEFSGESTGKLVIAKSIDKVENVIARAMKRGRKLLTAVVFKNGRIEEMHRSEGGDDPKREPYREPAEPSTAILKEDDKSAIAATVETVAKAAVTVAQPQLGCPVPEFERADVRATRVLKEFLTPTQLADFERTQSFVVVGADSGHRYILTSRQASPEQLAKVGGRSVFDIDMSLAVCVHDWVVPAAEELLELKLFLELPQRESYATNLPTPPVAYI
jgi:hypothetical protein